MENKFVVLPFSNSVTASLLQVFYPSFKVRTELTLMDKKNDVIYVGKLGKDLKEYLSANTHSFICPSELNADLVLRTRIDLVNWIIEKKGYKDKNGRPNISKSALADLDNLSDDEYLTYVKAFWVCGKWFADKSDDESALMLYQTLVLTDPYTNPRTKENGYITNLGKFEDLGIYVNALFKHLCKVLNNEPVGKEQYIRIVKRSNQLYGTEIRDAVLGYLKYADFYNDHLGVLRMVFRLKKIIGVPRR